jgi:hypothetical protein
MITIKEAKKTPETLRFQASLPVLLRYWQTSLPCIHDLFDPSIVVDPGAVRWNTFQVDLMQTLQPLCQSVVERFHRVWRLWPRGTKLDVFANGGFVFCF